MRDRAAAGAIVGAVLSAALAAISCLGWKLAGLPFPPFDLFDWLSRELPGSVVTFGIESSVVVLRMFHAGSTAAAAKSAEQFAALAAFLAMGAFIGGVVFIALRLSDEPALLLGGVLGGLAGTGTVVIETSLRRLSASSHLDAVWILATFLAWGMALGWVHDNWRAAGSAVRVDAAPSLSRRGFLTRVAWIAGVPAALTGVWAVTLGRARAPLGARWSDTHALPNAGARVTPVPGTRAEFTRLEDHYRIDVDTRAPAIDLAGWRLKISGLVDRPLELTLDDLHREEPLHQFVTLACISNPLGGDLTSTTRWTGVSLQRLVGRAAVQPGATHLKMRSADGFFEVVSLATVQADPRVMVTYAWDDVPLLLEHGFPLRIYIPDVYGMKQPKWVEEIEVTNHWEPGYWVERGWSRDGVMAATSVVDASNGKSVGGIAHAGARGISRVEVRVEDGPWAPAELREPLSATTWVVWRAEVQGPPGVRTVSVRCYDGAGALQSEPFHARSVKLQV